MDNPFPIDLNLNDKTWDRGPLIFLKLKWMDIRLKPFQDNFFIEYITLMKELIEMFQLENSFNAKVKFKNFMDKNWIPIQPEDFIFKMDSRWHVS